MDAFNNSLREPPIHIQKILQKNCIPILTQVCNQNKLKKNHKITKNKTNKESLWNLRTFQF